MHGWIAVALLFLRAGEGGAVSFPAVADLPVREGLPDPLVMLDGRKVDTAQGWLSARRPELKELFQHYMYGYLPPAPGNVAAQVRRTDRKFIEGAATLREITLKFGPSGCPPIDLLLILPNRPAGPVPVFLGMNFGGNHAVLEDERVAFSRNRPPGKRGRRSERGSKAGRWPVDLIVSRGYGLATFHCADVDPDRNDFTDGVHPHFGGGGKRGPHDWGTIAAWAWGLSRAVDYLVTDPGVDGNRIAVMGHSRLGKTALLAAAFDERIALAIPNMAGCGGTAPSRGIVGESVERINESFPHWFCDEFKKFSRTVGRLPFDQNCLTALVAPRPVLFNNAVEDTWANPGGQFEVLKAAEPVWLLLGAGGLGEDRMSEPGRLVGDTLAYHIRPGHHDVIRGDWEVYLAFADRHFKGKKTELKRKPEEVERWGIFELSLTGPASGNPYAEASFGAKFIRGGTTVYADGFYDGDGLYRVRFMPRSLGEWKYVTRSSVKALAGITGRFECVKPAEGNHGPVRVRSKFHFAYEDGTPYFPFGTTCYAWVHQSNDLKRKTMETLRSSPFNKIRMCVFPKDYLFNKNEPEHHPFEGDPPKDRDFARFNPRFFRHFERWLNELKEAGIEADVILLHPYDRWGYSEMSPEADDRYLRYVVARFAAYRNVWWSMANEWDFMKSKKPADWDRFFRIVRDSDPYDHLRSIHNGGKWYDHAKPWVTHASVQAANTWDTHRWRERYGKPVVDDECQYEGNVEPAWGNITGEELTRRFWDGFTRGGYVGHGETYLHPEDVLWWSKGGVLHGTSPKRIAFLRRIVEEAPVELNPLDTGWENAGCAGKEGEYYLWYFDIHRPGYRWFDLPKGKTFRVEVIDTWNMTIEPVKGTFSGRCRIELPGKPYVAVRITRG